MGIIRWLERRKVRKAFRQFVGPGQLAKLKELGQHEVEKQPVASIEAKHFQFVVVLVDDAKPEAIPPIISTVVACLLRNGAILESISSSLLVGLMGVPFPESDSPEMRAKLVDALLQENGNRIRIAHGQCTGAVGLLGTQSRCTYGGVIPGFTEILKRLTQSQSGTAFEAP